MKFFELSGDLLADARWNDYKRDDVGSEINKPLSYFRVPIYRNKKGGGARVKRILMYDKGIETGDAQLFGTSYFYVGEDGLIDYDRLEKDAINFKPKLIICGYSAYPRELNYDRFRKIADINDSYLLCDMAHFSGLVATQEMKDPFEYCDIVTT